jgi:hypothetical protein
MYTKANSDESMVVALPPGLIGGQCGEQFAISYQGRDVVVFAEDTCFGCSGFNIGMSSGDQVSVWFGSHIDGSRCDSCGYRSVGTGPEPRPLGCLLASDNKIMDSSGVTNYLIGTLTTNWPLVSASPLCERLSAGASLLPMSAVTRFPLRLSQVAIPLKLKV